MKLGLALAAAAAGPAVVVAASKILLVGDSWAEQGGTPLAEVLKKHGSPLQVINKGIGGTTAAQWAENPDKVRTLVELNGGKDIEFIWVSLGGNDAQETLPGCQIAGGTRDECVAKTIAQVMRDTGKILDPVVAEFPEVKIFQFGYDILNVRTRLHARARVLLARACVRWARSPAHSRVACVREWMGAALTGRPRLRVHRCACPRWWVGECASTAPRDNNPTTFCSRCDGANTQKHHVVGGSSGKAWSARRWAWRCSRAAWTA
jgi:hypothetical protein